MKKYLSSSLTILFVVTLLTSCSVRQSKGRPIIPPESWPTINKSETDFRREFDANLHNLDYLEGIWIGGRLAVVFSNKGYTVNWNEISGNDAQLKMGVNLMVFALTQPGGIASEE